MMFVFAAGLELDLGDAWENRRETAITAGCALIVRLLLGAAGVRAAGGSAAGDGGARDGGDEGRERRGRGRGFTARRGR